MWNFYKTRARRGNFGDLHTNGVVEKVSKSESGYKRDNHKRAKIDAFIFGFFDDRGHNETS